MKIESIILRKGGTKISFGTPKTPGFIEYHFKPDESGRHVADVVEPKHIDRLLSVSQAFKVLHEVDQKEPEPNVSSIDDGLDLLDKHALGKEYESRYGEPASQALSKAKLIEAIRARSV